MEDIVDVYCLGTQPMDRWRPYVRINEEGKLEPLDWTPQGENNRWIHKKEFHARCAMQYSFLAAYAEENGWEITATLLGFRTCAVLDLRYCELVLADFQLLTNTVGIDNRTTDRDELYLTAKMLHSTHLFLHDVIAKCKGVKRSNRKEVLQEAPSITDGKVKLARSICTGVRATKLYYQPAFEAMRQRLETGDLKVERDMESLMKRMQMVMRQLDRVLVVLTEDPRCEKLKVGEL